MLTVKELKEFIKDIPDDVEVGIWGWMEFQSLTEPKRITYGKDLKTNESMVWEQGDLIYDLKYKEVFSMELNRDAEVLFHNPQRFRLATEDEIKTLYKD